MAEPFEVEVDGVVYDVDAPDAETAWAWAHEAARQEKDTAAKAKVDRRNEAWTQLKENPLGYVKDAAMNLGSDVIDAAKGYLQSGGPQASATGAGTGLVDALLSGGKNVRGAELAQAPVAFMVDRVDRYSPQALAETVRDDALMVGTDAAAAVTGGSGLARSAAATAKGVVGPVARAATATPGRVEAMRLILGNDRTAAASRIGEILKPPVQSPPIPLPPLAPTQTMTPPPIPVPPALPPVPPAPVAMPRAAQGPGPFKMPTLSKGMGEAGRRELADILADVQMRKGMGGAGTQAAEQGARSTALSDVGPAAEQLNAARGHGVAGFSRLPELPPAEVERLSDAIRQVMGGAGREGSVTAAEQIEYFLKRMTPEQRARFAARQSTGR